MPCSDGLALDRIEQEERKHTLEAMLCALLTELGKTNTGNQLIIRASENGKVDIHEFWNKHKEEDKIRLKRQLKKYSKHELEIIKKLL